MDQKCARNLSHPSHDILRCHGSCCEVQEKTQSENGFLWRVSALQRKRSKEYTEPATRACMLQQPGLGQQLCQAQRGWDPGHVCSVCRDFQLTENLFGCTHASKPSSASSQTRVLLPSHLCWFTAGELRCSGNHTVSTLLSVSILLGCPGLASIPGHCSRERIRQGMFPEVRIDESTVLRRGKEFSHMDASQSLCSRSHCLCYVVDVFIIHEKISQV